MRMEKLRAIMEKYEARPKLIWTFKGDGQGDIILSPPSMLTTDFVMVNKAR